MNQSLRHPKIFTLSLSVYVKWETSALRLSCSYCKIASNDRRMKDAELTRRFSLHSHIAYYLLHCVAVRAVDRRAVLSMPVARGLLGSLSVLLRARERCFRNLKLQLVE